MPGQSARSAVVRNFNENFNLKLLRRSALPLADCLHFDVSQEIEMSSCSERAKSRLLSPDYIWVAVISVAWLVFGGCVLLDIFSFKPVALGVFIGVFFMMIPFGVFLRKKWGFYGSLILSVLTMLQLPLGTIIGAITIKALFDCKSLFHVK